MPIEYTVHQGECLSSIAKQYGFPDWKTIYNDDLNCDLRQARPDPNVLFPGDRVLIPDKKVKRETGPTTVVNSFLLTGEPTRLRVIIRDIDGQPLAGKKFKLTVAGKIREDFLPDDGLLDQPIPADALEGELMVWALDDFPDYPDTWTLKLGHMDPVEKLSGVQARLNNLGYDCGPVDGMNGPLTKAAVRAFQKAHGLEVDGIPGPQTQAALKGEHGS